MLNLDSFYSIQAPIAWDSVDVSPVKNADGTMGIPQVLLILIIYTTRRGSPLNSRPSTDELHHFVLNYAKAGQDLVWDIKGSCNLEEKGDFMNSSID